MSKILVFENIIPQIFQDKIESTLIGDINFPWYLDLKTVGYIENGDNSDLFYDANTKDGPQFAHSFIRNEFQNSEKWPTIAPILYFLMAKTGKQYAVIRCKANLNVPGKEFESGNYYPPHKDPAPLGGWSCVYYVNDCDGDTLFFKDPGCNVSDKPFEVLKKINPKKGSLVLFPSATIHCGTPPKKSNLRSVINFVLKEI